MNGNRTFLKREDPNKWNFFSQPTLYISKGDDINWTSSMTKQAFEGMLMLQLNALIHLHFCDSLTRCWCFWTSWSGNTYFIKVLFDKKYNTSWMNILFHGKLYQMEYHKFKQSEIGDMHTWFWCCWTHDILQSELHPNQGTNMKTVEINTLFISTKIFHTTCYAFFLRPNRNGDCMVFSESALYRD